ncbi:MAG: SusD/RagB family nutrient-binding outer membrane lipoprotein [Chitinophagaceae bacterium]|nr:MAG: SusD/RagB family nutrient-binding outer membrane lipoprotein [Chitinophagaceae bacterium]
MKLSKIYILAAMILCFSSCKKWLDINEDPANPQVATGEVLLSPIQYQMANNVANDYRFVFKYVQFWANQNADPNWEKHAYESGSDNGGSIWRMTYFNLGKNLELMIQDGVDNGKYSFAGIGYAIKAWAYQMTTDYHGPIILDQALDDERISYNYQDQPEVYEKVREWARMALFYLDKADAKDYSSVLSGISGDQIYKGDRGKWKKFVYGLLALQYSHLRNKAEFTSAYADSVVKYVDLSFANESESATVNFNGSNAAESNIFGPSAGLITSTASTSITMGRVTQTIVDLLSGGMRSNTPRADTLKNTTTFATTSVDPRLPRMIAPNTDSVYRGVIPTYGDPNTTKKIPHVLGSVAAPYPGKYIFADKARFPIMTYSQLQFAKAEALFVKGQTGPAHAAYIKGIEGHMDFVNRYGLWQGAAATAPPITAQQITAYKASSDVAQTPADLTIADIMGQKFVAQWGWAGLEQWNDLRKYHYDTTVFKTYYLISGSEIDTRNLNKLVYRVRPRYNSEYIWNRTELDKWGGLNGDYHTYELWFSKP